MVRPVLLLLIPLFCGAQTFTVPPKVTNISHASARVTFLLSEPVTNADVQWSQDLSFSKSAPVTINTSAPVTGSAVLMGLTPGTTYNVRARLNNGAVVSPTVQFTTAADVEPHPALPLPPQVVPDTSMPAINGNTYTINSDCSNLQSVLNTLATLTGNLNHEVVIPVGTVCEGQFTFPARPNHSGWVIVRSSAVGTTAFPPEGVRWTPKWPVSSTLATFRTNVISVAFTSMNHTFVSWTGSPNCEGIFGNDAIVGVLNIAPGLTPYFDCRTDRPAYTGPTAITNMTGTNPVTVTAPGHNLENGMVVYFSNNGMVAAAPTTWYMVFNVSGDTFQITPNNVIGSFNASLNPTFTVVPAWRQLESENGPTDPSGPCTVGEWYWKHGDGQNGIWWCRDDGWQKYVLRSTSGSFEAISLASGARRYRFIGIEVTQKRTPPFPAGWNTPTASGSAYQGVVQALVNASEATSEIIIDRCYLHGLGYPHRNRYAITGYFSKSAFINNYIDEISWWRSSGYSQTEGGTGINLWRDSNGVLTHNNYIAVAGIHYFAPDQGSDRQQPGDLTITRNTFKQYPKWRRGDPANDGRNYTHRNHIECKQCERLLIEGNIFDYGYSSLTAGQFILMTPRCSTTGLSSVYNVSSFNNGTITTTTPHYIYPGAVVHVNGTGSALDGLWEVSWSNCPSPCNEMKLAGAPSISGGAGGTVQMRQSQKNIRDVAVRHNLFYQGAETLRITGTDTSCTSQRIVPFQRFQMHNNLVVDTNILRFSQGGRVDEFGTFGANGDFGARTLYVIGYLEDVTVTNNTVYGQRGNMPFLLYSEPVNEGLKLENNLYTWNGSGALTALGGTVNSTTTFGTAGLAATWTRDGTPNYSARNNVICCGLSSNASSYPTTTSWPDNEASVKWMKPALSFPYDFRLRHDSSFVSAGSGRGTDEREVGADIDLMEAKQGRVKNARAVEITSTSAVIAYLAPDEAACTVEYGPSATWGTGTRVGDGGGRRDRAVHLTGLTPSSVYYYRILCSVEQPDGIFRTP